MNAKVDVLGIVIKLKTGKTFDDLQYAMNKGTVAVGAHVQSIAAGTTGNGASDTFKDDKDAVPAPSYPTPVPAAVWLFGSAFLGVVGLASRKKPTQLEA